jgi:serine protease DegQ
LETFMRKSWLIFSQTVTVALGVYFVVATLKPHWITKGTSPAAATISVQTAPASPSLPQVPATNSYSVAAKRASPAVVSITASKAPVRNTQRNDPWFEFFFGQQQQGNQPQMGLGSGVIVAEEGYLLTNNHVIEGADDIQVMLTDGRKAQAKVVGTDPESDLAVLKITLDKLPAITFGNVDQLQVGDVVLAIGNPFGVGQTVTSGIVSALGRNQLGINTFENFIQTDAAINPGNSGGALVDIQGNLQGINTAIFSRSGGSMGIGFAIPANTAQQVMQSLIKEGQVRRGWIGVETRELTPEISETFNLPVNEGVLITGVLQDGPAGTAGIRPGDVVVKINEVVIKSPSQLLTTVANLVPNKPATFHIQRGRDALNMAITVGQRPKMQTR